MSDQERTIDADKFEIFRRVRLKSGFCATKKHCPEFDHTTGPVESKPKCVGCFNESMQRIGIS